jgi:transcriptional regulator with XRE-family HTH domain
VDDRSEVRDFLASRRARITPEQAGLPIYGGNRRVPGLRREELALLAGVSVDYYTRLERGNLSGASDSVLEAFARALQLDEAERAHLFDLARASGAAPARSRRTPKQQVRPSVQAMLDAMTAAPAVVRNGRLDILATNALGRALYSELYRDPVRPANHARFAFLDPRARDFWIDWERAANDTVGILRAEAGRNPLRPGPDRPGRRALHPQRGLPHPLGRAQRPPAPHREQAHQPPGRRPPRARVRHPGTGRRHRPDDARLHRRTGHLDPGRAHPAGQLGGDP